MSPPTMPIICPSFLELFLWRWSLARPRTASLLLLMMLTPRCKRRSVRHTPFLLQLTITVRSNPYGKQQIAPLQEVARHINRCHLICLSKPLGDEGIEQHRDRATLPVIWHRGWLSISGRPGRFENALFLVCRHCIEPLDANLSLRPLLLHLERMTPPPPPSGHALTVELMRLLASEALGLLTTRGKQPAKREERRWRPRRRWRCKL